MQVHLLDATYELFRAHFGRPPTQAPDGKAVGATVGIVESILGLLRDAGRHARRLRHGPRHPFLAQRTLRGLQDRGRHAARAAGAVPAGRGWRSAAIGVVVWPMVEFEADDALGAAAAQFADEPAVERVVILSPDKDMTQCVREDGRVVCYDRRARAVHRRRRRAREVRRLAGLDPRLPGARR